MWITWLLLRHLLSPSPGSQPCETPAPAESAAAQATTAEKSVREAAAIFVHTSSPGDDMDTDAAPELTRADVEEALTNLAAHAARLPRHFVERKRVIHERIDELLYDWEILA
jgi:hypothetical protein